MQKIILNTIETVKINDKEVIAKIDTGADRNSICDSMVEELNLKPTRKKVIVKSSHGTSKREVFTGKLEIKGKILETEFTTIDRNNLNYSVLIGRNTLKHGFLVDPSK